MELKRSFVQLALIMSGAVAQLASAATLSAPGILVNGDGSQHFKRCSTCPDEPLLDSDEKGGNNVGSAQTTGGAVNSFSWLAAGTLLGPNALPVLKARPEAQNPSIADPSLGIGTVSAVATARGAKSHALNLLSMAKSNRARSRMRLAICSRIRTAQMSLSFNGDFCPMSLPLFQGS